MSRPKHLEWCGHCDERTRTIGEDNPAPCDDCHRNGERAREQRATAGGEIPVTEGLITLSAVKERRVRWLWPGRLPAGHLVLIDGDPGVGKSTVSLDFAARISVGCPWPDGTPCRQGRVLLMTAEEGLAETVLPRILLSGGDPAMVDVLKTVPGGDGPRLPSLPLDVPYIEQVVRQRRSRLVIVDVLSSYLGETVDTHTDAKVRRALFPLFEMAQSTGTTVLALRHMTKQGDNKNAVYRGQGSIGIIGQARAAYLIAPDPVNNERRIFCPTKINLGPMPPSLAYSLIPDDASGCASVVWSGEDPLTAAELLALPLDADDREEQDQSVAWLQDYLFHAGGSATGGDILKAAAGHGYSKRTIQRARKRAGISFRRAGWQAGSVWTLDAKIMAELRKANARPVDLVKHPRPARGTCPGCAREVAIRKDGLTRMHRNRGIVCEGSARPPDPHSRHSRHSQACDANGANEASPATRPGENQKKEAQKCST